MPYTYNDFYYEDRIRSVTTSTGTGNLVLSAGTGPWKPINAVSINGRYFYYCVVHENGTEWELGVGYLNGSGNLVREAKSSSDGTGFVNFTAGQKEVFVTHSALTIKDLAPLALAGGSLAPGRPVQVTTTTATPVTLTSSDLPGLSSFFKGVYEYTVCASEPDNPTFKAKSWLVRVTIYPTDKFSSTAVAKTVTALAETGSPVWTVDADSSGNLVLTGASGFTVYWNVFERVLGAF